MVQSIRPLMIIPERSLVLRKYVSFWVIILFIILTAGCTITHEFGPFMGKVVDAESGEPVKGAVVLIVFSIESSSLGGSVNSFADAIETLTDAQGEFKFTPKRINFFKMNASWDDDCQVSIFKPGYGAYPGHQQAYSSWKKKQSRLIPEDERKARAANGAYFGLVDTFIHAVKERIQRFIEDLGSVFLKTVQAADNYRKMAA
jgi:hypothetical protein